RHHGDVAIRGPVTEHRRGGLHDHAGPYLVDAGGVGELHVVDPAIHTIHHQIDPLPHFVAGQPLADDPADDLLAGTLAVNGVLADAPVLGEAVVLQRPVHGVDDVLTDPKLLQGCFGFVQ